MSQNKDKILFFRESTFKIAGLIFNHPNKSFHVRMLEKESGFSTTAVLSSAQELASYEIVKIEDTPITKNIKADLDSEAYRSYKLVFNLYRLKKYLFVDQLIGSYSPETIVLFGSFAKGEDIEESDIDILIITSNKPKMQPSLISFLSNMEKNFNRKINIHVLPNLEKSSPEFRNNIANGIVLHGYLKVV